MSDITWRKSTCSAQGQCVELGWRTSSFTDRGNCVELTTDGDEIRVRDSKNPAGPVLTFTRGEMNAFVLGVKAGEFDDLCL